MKDILIQPGSYFACGSETTARIHCNTACNVVLVFLDVTTQSVVVGNILLPLSSISKQSVSENSVLYADMAVPFLLNAILEQRSLGEGRDFDVIMVGGSDAGEKMSLPDMGSRNIKEIENQFKRYNLFPTASYVGGSIQRKVIVDTQNMKTCIKSSGKEDIMI